MILIFLTDKWKEHAYQTLFSISHFLYLLFLPPYTLTYQYQYSPHSPLFIFFDTDKENLFNTHSFFGWQSVPLFSSQVLINEGGHSDFLFCTVGCFQIGFSVFFLGQKTVVFQFKCVLQLADFLFFSICLLVFINITSEFLDLVSDVVFWFFLFGFLFLLYFSSNYAPPLIWNSHKTSACSTCH